LKRLKGALFLSIVACILALVCVNVKNIFSVKEIIITSNHSKDYLLGLEQYHLQFLPFLSVEDVQNELVKKNPIATEVKASKVYPNKLILNIQIGRPVASVNVGGEYALLSANGRILEKVKTRPIGLAEIKYYQQVFKEQVKIGELFGFNDLQMAVRFVDILRTIGYKVSRVDIDSFYMIRLELDGSREILVTADKDIQEQEYQINAILRQFKIDGSEFKRIDVRYNKPIMTK